MTHEHTITPTRAKRIRNRKSKLAEHFHTVATLLLANVRLAAKGKPRLSLQKMTDAIKRKHDLDVNKSTLSRFISKHKLLKLF